MKKTKTALLQSAIALLLCISMLIGSTFAWFTDNVTTVNNIITSGNLDLEMYWTDDLDSGVWYNVEDGEHNTIFSYDNWEPGYTDVKYVKLVNAGKLALNYDLAIEAPSGVGKLAEVINVFCAEGAIPVADRSDLDDLSCIGFLNNVMNGGVTADGTLLPSNKQSPLHPSGEVVITVAMTMITSAGNEYQDEDAGTFTITALATQAQFESDSFGSDYDADAEYPTVLTPDSVTAPVTAVDGKVSAGGVWLIGNEISAFVPAGTVLEDGVTELTFTTTPLENTTSDITVVNGEILIPVDVHIEGIADTNTVASIIYLGEVLPKYLNLGNYRIFHVEDSGNQEMTMVDSVDDLTSHNQFYYDSNTGEVTVAMATFSEVAILADTDNGWNGNRSYEWYTEAEEGTTTYTITNADDLAGLSAIVGGMTGVDGETIAQDSFKGKTIKLISNINLADEEGNNEPDKIFYPIGYYSSDGLYEKTGEAITSGFYTFEGTFDGQGHTISNFYHNTWEMKGDHNWYAPEDQYYRDGMGLFGKVYGGTVKNLTINNFTSDGEIATTGVIAAYADYGATFENIAITNCNPRVYNIGNGGIVGCVGWYAKATADKKVTFENITVDNSNKISALWGSYDVPCGGIVGQYYPTSGQSSYNYPSNPGIHFENCHVAAQMDVYNDVCANYQYYAYRYSGMIIGSIRENETIDGRLYPKMDGITAEGCSVYYDTWNDYYYCELVANTLASYTHDHQFSRLTEVKSVDLEANTYVDLKGVVQNIPASGRYNFVVVNGSHATENATCYHFVDGAQWNHEDAGCETTDIDGDGVVDSDVLKEDKQHYYLPFKQLFTGYGWGVTSGWIEDYDGFKVYESKYYDSITKFAEVDGVSETYTTGDAVTIGDIFKALDDLEVGIQEGNVQVFVSPVGDESTAGATYTANTTDWTQGTLTFSGLGAATISITDYHYCKTTTINVTIKAREPEVKFETKFTGDFLYRVGNENAVKLDSLFKAKDGAEIGNVTVTVAGDTDETYNSVSGTYTAGASGWTNGTIKFSGTGFVTVTIADDDPYCKPTVLKLEVIEATNVTSAASATSNNVVLLNDVSTSGGINVSGRYALYGNGFTCTYTGNGKYLNNGLKQGIITVSENGILDNLRIKASIYPTAYLYYEEAQAGEYEYEASSNKTRYFYQLSAVAASDNATISNCYIYGARNNVFVDTGNVTIKDTILECGTLSNVQIQSNSDHTVTFENVTTIQHQVNPTIGDTSLVMLGAGIIVGPETESNPKIVLNGDFKQYNWVTAADKNAVASSTYSDEIIEVALGVTAFNHTVNGETASNMGIIYLNNYEAEVENNTELPYVLGEAKLLGETGKVYSLQGAAESQIYSDYENADRSTDNGNYIPQFKYSSDLGGQYIAKTDDGDEFCYRDGDVIKVMFPTGETKELNLEDLVTIEKYTGQDLNLQITCKDSSGNAVTLLNNVITLSEAGTYDVTYTVTDDLSIKYSWNVTVEVSLKDNSIPNAYFAFDSTKQTMGYAKKSFLSSGYTQYLPFLAGLKIYDYNGQTAYLRFDGDNDFAKIAAVEITGYTSANHVLIKVTLTDGGVINIDTTARAASGGSTYTGTIQTSGNTVYYVNGGTTSATTTTWVISSYTFTGNNGVTVDSGTVTFSNCENGSVPTGSFSTTINYTVSYDANGGNCGQTVGYATSATAAVTLPTPSRSGYIFAGWYTAASGGTKIGDAGATYTPSANITLYAHWKQPCTVTYNANGGSCDTTSEKYSGTALTLPTATRDGYWFIGWYTAASDGTKIGDAGATYTPSEDITLYAQWQEQVEYTVTYNANGGSCNTTSEKYSGTALTLPTPTRTGYTFSGWYTAASGGTRIGDAGATYTPSANITLYAQWQINSYTITVTTSNATVSGVTNGDTAEYGETISVTVSFSGSKEKSLTVTDESGNTLLSKSAAGTYTFTMPASDVTISASSSTTCVTADTLVTLADGTQKRIDQITYADQLLVWDFDKGEYTVAGSSIIENHGYDYNTVIKLCFEDGTTIKAVNVHGFFDAELNKWVDINGENAENFIGHSFVQVDGHSYKTVKLTSVEVRTEYVEAWSILTVDHYNCIMEGLFSITPPATEQLAFFEIGEGMKYDAEAKQADIEKYGLFTYDEFAHLMTEEQFDAFNMAEIKIAIGKGLITFEEVLALLATYA